MIINKSSSDEIWVNSLVVRDGSSFLDNVTEFDTETMEATLLAGGPVTASQYWFAPEDEAQYQALVDAIPVNTIEQIIDADAEGNPTDTAQITIKDFRLLSRVRKPGKFHGKKAMDDSDTTPTDYHEVLSTVSPILVQCSNCSTKFIVYITPDNKVYETERVRVGDKHLTAIEITDPGNYTCDNCSNTVALMREEWG